MMAPMILTPAEARAERDRLVKDGKKLVFTNGCFDILNDAANCGGCGKACAAGQQCVSGACSACPQGQVVCSNACTTTATDLKNCGACGHSCGPNSTCSSGKCGCANNQIYCNDVLGCIDTSADVNNCGACGNTCGAGEICSSGQCVCGVPGQTFCGGFKGCVDLSSNPNACGACNTVCGAGQVCSAGKCACPQGKTQCGNLCVDQQTDPRACGGCGQQFQCALGDTCVAGKCQACAGTMCQETLNGQNVNVCSDTQHDPEACGACGATCNGNNQGGYGRYCAAGKCACKPGLTSCNAFGGTQCVDTQASFFNCGGCGNQCQFNQHCVAGKCQNTGNSCNSIGQHDCGGACLTDADLEMDPLNCGGCNNRCQANQVCVAGACTGFVTTPGCNTCPCGACGANSTCCSYPGANPAFPICVAGNSCP